MIILFDFLNIKTPDFTGDIKSDVKNWFYLNNDPVDYKPKTFEHSKAVADKNIEIAKQYGLDINICELCGYLHDISGIMPYGDMMKYAVENDWHLGEAEKRFPMLLHQRISKVFAGQYFNIADERVLAAVECHSTLKASPSGYDMALFIADKLAWDQEAEAPFYNIVNGALKKSLEAASLAYMDYIVENKMILYPHKWFEEGRVFLRGLNK